MTPRKDGGHWRTGAIYVLPAYRSLGIATKAIKLFVRDHHPTVSVIETTNTASMKAFDAAGFDIVDTKVIGGQTYSVMLFK